MSALGHVALVGLPGSGKSTLAPLIAERLGCGWVDTDDEVAARLHMSVAQAFAQLGEPVFRAQESDVMEEVLQRSRPQVIACGGGLIAQPGMAQRLRRQATVVWLDSPDAHLLERLGDQANDRPLLGRDPANALQRLRRARATAHGSAGLRVDVTGRAPGELADQVASRLRDSIQVATGRSYLATVAAGAVDALVEQLPAESRCVAVIADEAVEPVSDRVEEMVRRSGRVTLTLRVRGGESVKRWDVAGSLLEQCAAAGLDRGDCVVAVGGGTIGDLAGFVAATYLRGVEWLVVPTTLLAMVDSAIGGKTAVNLPAGKNLAGAFWQPRAVICDPELLATLPERCFRSGFAEIIKSSMVGGGDLPSVVESRLAQCLRRDSESLAEVVRACCALKASVVASDEREHGRRAILNYGHTVGHAVEAFDGREGPDHGEAVALGMRVAGALSILEVGCPRSDITWQNHLLDESGLTLRAVPDPGAVADRLGRDKKARGGVPRWVLVRARGDPVTGVVIDRASIERALTGTLPA